jgi:hypothetical protein
LHQYRLFRKLTDFNNQSKSALTWVREQTLTAATQQVIGGSPAPDGCNAAAVGKTFSKYLFPLGLS